MVWLLSGCLDTFCPFLRDFVSTYSYVRPVWNSIFFGREILKFGALCWGTSYSYGQGFKSQVWLSQLLDDQRHMSLFSSKLVEDDHYLMYNLWMKK